jgi:hypothetical protein
VGKDDLGQVSHVNRASISNVSSSDQCQHTGTPIDSHITPYQPTNCDNIPIQRVNVNGKRQLKQPRVKQLRFQSSWFKKYKWLHYEESLRGVLCFSCAKAHRAGLVDLAKCAETAFISTGFTNWKRALTKFDLHEKFITHRHAVSQLSQLRLGSINGQLSKQILDDQQAARKGILAVMTTLQYIARQGLAIRGADSDSGNFKTLLKLRSGDIPALKTWMQRKTDLTSPDVQNEILQMFSHEILRNIRNSIQTNTFAIIVDGTQDVAGVEQEAICVRYVDESLHPHEMFLGFYATDDTTGEGIANLVKDALVRFGMPLELLRYQTYDGAANMSGSHNGCQAVVKRDQPLALYVHCGAHVTHLVASSASSSIPLIRDSLSLVQDLGNLNKASGKVKLIFKRMESNIDVASCDTPQAFQSIKPLCPTRWLSRCAAITPVLSGYSHVLQSLEAAATELVAETATKASGLLKRFEDASTLLGLEMTMQVLPLLESLNKSLQSTSMTASGMIDAVMCVKNELKRRRSEEEFKVLLARVNSSIEDLELEPLRLPRQKKVPARFTGSGAAHQATSVEDYFRPKYYEFIDHCTQQLETRFSSDDMKTYSSIESVLLSTELLPDDAHIILSKYPEVNTTYLQSELPMFHRHAKVKLTSLTQVVIHARALKKEVRDLFPSVIALIRLLLLCPASSAEAERSFSSLRRLKTWLRTTMTQQRLNSVALCHVHQDLLDSIDMDAILRDFVSRSEIRKNIFGTVLP